ncbi:MAG TPA: hypothetical protein VMY18_11345 [Acidobacteriota bacterium]|nr:hypothetical protein [Acidobacteriota bacterium]
MNHRITVLSERRLILIVLALLFFGCAPKVEISENEAVRQATNLEDAHERIEALQAFLRDYPDSQENQYVYGRLFRDCLALDQVGAALAAAEQELKLTPQEDLLNFYLAKSSLLAQKGVGLEKAVEYGARAASIAREEDSRLLPRVLDSYALALHRSGDSEQAESLQDEAMQKMGQHPLLLRHLAWIRWANGKAEPALNALAQSLLLRHDNQRQGWDFEDLATFESWMQGMANDPTGRGEFKVSLVSSIAKENLATRASPKSKSEVAAFLARTGVELDWAETLAREGFASLKEETSDNDRIQLASNLAHVLRAQGRYEQMLEVLKAVEDAAAFSHLEYWFLVGKAYSGLGQNEQAVASFITSLVFAEQADLELPGFRAGLGELGITDEQIALLIEKEKEAARGFDPGTYSGTNTTGRVVLAELFTGSDCRPCVAADMAFDLLADYYPRSSLALLEYHVHVPGADPMTNPHTEQRKQFYGGNFGTPNVFVDGKTRMGGGGTALARKANFFRYNVRIEAALEPEPRLELLVDGSRQGERLSLTAEVRSSQSIPNGRVFAALVEKSVDYDRGWNGIKKHAFVVRYLFGDPDGTPLDALEEGKLQQEVSLEEIEKGLLQYLLDFEKSPPERFDGFEGWDVKPVEMDANNLAVVVWVQNPDTREVYEARYADIESR